MKKTIVLGVDVGGSHITAALVDAEKGEIIEGSEARESLNSTGTAENIIATWIKCMNRSLTGLLPGTVPVGIAMPGPFDYEKGISRILQQDKFRSLYGLPLKQVLGGPLHLSEDQLYFMNDACSFLKGEMLGGALRGQEHVMGITLGTGLGSAFSRGGDVVDGDLWQSSFDNGIAEDYLSTRWFTGRYKELSGRTVTGVKELTELPSGDPLKEQLFREFAGNLVRFVQQQHKQYQYTNIVIGGNIAKAAPHFLPEMETRISAHGSGLKFCFAELGEKAALVGAAGMAYTAVHSGKLV